jgi:hypothetical protein
MEVAYLDTVKSYIKSAIKESVSFDWIRLTGFPFHHQRIEDENVGSVNRISNSWRYKRKNESLGDVTRRNAIKR